MKQKFQFIIFKTWMDMKNEVKKKYKLKRQNMNQTGAGPIDVTFSELEERISAICGKQLLDGDEDVSEIGFATVSTESSTDGIGKSFFCRFFFVSNALLRATKICFISSVSPLKSILKPSRKDDATDEDIDMARLRYYSSKGASTSRDYTAVAENLRSTTTEKSRKRPLPLENDSDGKISSQFS